MNTEINGQQADEINRLLDLWIASSYQSDWGFVAMWCVAIDTSPDHYQNDAIKNGIVFG